MKKKILILEILILMMLALALVGCSEKELHTHTFDQKVVSEQFLKVEATHASAAEYYYSCTCGEKGEESFTDGDPLAEHVFDQNIATETYLKHGATCSSKAVYYKSCICGEKGTETFTAGELLAHVYNQENVSISYRKSAASCTSKAIYYKSCVCGSYGEETFEFGAILSHTYDQEVATADCLKTAADCTHKAVYHYSCVCGEKAWFTFEHGDFVHACNQENHSDTFLKEPATCTSLAVYYKSCSCGQVRGTETFTYGSVLPHTYDQEVKTEAYIKTPGTLTEKTVYYKSCICGLKGTDTFEGEVVSPEDFYEGFTFAEYKNGYEITGYTGNKTVFTIPAHNSLPVLRIGEDAFKNCAGLKYVVIPSGVTSIGDGAFSGCTALETIVIPDSVEIIGNSVFDSCTRLVYTEFGNCKYLGNAANPHLVLVKASTTAAQSVTIHEQTKLILSFAFSGCKSLSSAINIPLNVKRIGEAAFYNINSSVTVASGHTVYEIQNNCLIEKATNTLIFGRKNTTTDCTIPTGVKIIGAYAFAGQTNIASVSISNDVECIEKDAFYGCSGLTALHIPAGVTSIGDRAFGSCNGLTQITVDSANTVYKAVGNCLIDIANQTVILGCKNSTIPTDAAEVTAIGDFAFYGCTGLTTLHIPANITAIGDRAFGLCSGLNQITVDSANMVYKAAGNCLIDIANQTVILGCKNSTIPTDAADVTKIGDFAFYGCTGLTALHIPAGVTSIGDRAFGYCSGLTSITVDSDNAVYDAVENCLIEKATDTLILGCKVSTIPDSVTKIADYAFAGCTGLQRIEIPVGVISIGENAFKDCPQNLTITVKEGNSNYRITNNSLMEIETMKIIFQFGVTNAGTLDGTGWSDLID